MPRLAEWYVAAFELDVLARSPVAVIATYDHEHHRFGFTQLRGEPQPLPQRSPLKHIAYAYNSIADLVAQYRHMKSLGHEPVECVNHGPTLSFYYRDPDGNGVEFFIDRFATMEESKAFMSSEPFKKNLFGYYVDPQKVAAQSDEGVSAEEILRYDQAAADEMLKRLTALS
jgi:catechol-2,3-dioxygenase